MGKRSQTPPKTFEEGLGELEQIIYQMEEGKIGLEESLQRQERGQFLLTYCRSILDKAEQQIELIARASDGSTKTTPLPEAGAGASETSAGGAESADKATDDPTELDLNRAES